MGLTTEQKVKGMDVNLADVWQARITQSFTSKPYPTSIGVLEQVKVTTRFEFYNADGLLIHDVTCIAEDYNDELPLAKAKAEVTDLWEKVRAEFGHGEYSPDRTSITYTRQIGV